jgi:hypothetical protein
MGDRRNVVLCFDPDDEDRRVYLYTHWYGDQLPLIVQNAIRRRERWDDPPYLSRIIFSEMIGDEKNLKDSMGFGIDVSICDTNYPDREIEIYFKDQCIKIGLETWTFEEYMALGSNELPE